MLTEKEIVIPSWYSREEKSFARIETNEEEPLIINIEGDKKLVEAVLMLIRDNSIVISV